MVMRQLKSAVKTNMLRGLKTVFYGFMVYLSCRNGKTILFCRQKRPFLCYVAYWWSRYWMEKIAIGRIMQEF